MTAPMMPEGVPSCYQHPAVDTPAPRPQAGQLARSCALLGAWAALALGSGCERAAPPGAPEGEEGPGPGLSLVIGDADGEQGARAEAPSELGTPGDQLPFEPTGEKVASIAWRTWIYTDTGPNRTRLGYLRAGAVVDARGPALVNSGCEGGWYRINPRGFVCMGKGATTDLSRAVVVQSSTRPERGAGFPYRYGMSEERPPDRYFRLPSVAQMNTIEGERVMDRAVAWKLRAQASGLYERLGVEAEPPEFLRSGGGLEKPYGVKNYLRTQVHAGRASRESGFAFARFFEWQSRVFGVTTEMDILPLDRVRLRDAGSFNGVVIPEGAPLAVGFHLKGVVTHWERTESGAFRPVGEQRDKRAYLLTGERATGGLLETSEGFWIARDSLRLLEPREGFPSVATGSRKWIDISIRDQTLVAYEGQRPVFATLVSTGRGGMGDPEKDQATVRGTFMIYEKSVSSTMDGDDDHSDSFELQDVPFVQYFHKGFALHGAYWHHDFGRARSHGCVNLTAADASFLFEWTDPPVPEGWHAVLNKERGTVVYVRR